MHSTVIGRNPYELTPPVRSVSWLPFGYPFNRQSWPLMSARVRVTVIPAWCVSRPSRLVQRGDLNASALPGRPDSTLAQRSVGRISLEGRHVCLVRLWEITKSLKNGCDLGVNRW